MCPPLRPDPGPLTLLNSHIRPPLQPWLEASAANVLQLLHPLHAPGRDPPLRPLRPSPPASKAVCVVYGLELVRFPDCAHLAALGSQDGTGTTARTKARTRSLAEGRLEGTPSMICLQSKYKSELSRSEADRRHPSLSLSKLGSCTLSRLASAATAFCSSTATLRVELELFSCGSQCYRPPGPGHACRLASSRLVRLPCLNCAGPSAAPSYEGPEGKARTQTTDFNEGYSIRSNVGYPASSHHDKRETRAHLHGRRDHGDGDQDWGGQANGNEELHGSTAAERWKGKGLEVEVEDEEEDEAVREAGHEGGRRSRRRIKMRSNQEIAPGP
ncbi:hypothetical protein CSOJ01_07602 [Colletotrichum sojae]|uniref:Uncharacterized protein n=1 Tax=Colletotrichum sojae TaxID=2175907 RepID=A0A8H6J8B4_9PEZI|nr:hypothetical protein CSOJ01_07602 [Colletotrichum sojae]